MSEDQIDLLECWLRIRLALLKLHRLLNVHLRSRSRRPSSSRAWTLPNLSLK